MKARKNSLKIKTLGIFQRRGWLNPASAAVLVGFFPPRAMYSYLLRLHRWGLLKRRRNTWRGSLAYMLSQRGRSRLDWLLKHRA
jgi:hypothetical protein